MRSNNLKIIETHQMCTSCGLCESVFGREKLEMKLNEEGYYVPSFKQTLTDKETNLFSDMCPCLNMSGPEKDKETNFDSIIGNYVSYYNGYSANQEIRYHASTGGGITSFCSFLLGEGYVEGVLHIGPGKNVFHAESSLSEKVEDITSKMGSQYMPTSLLINILKILQNEELIAVVGKPCDIRALDNLLKEYPELRKKVFMKISFLCGGMPSIKSTYKIISSLGAEPEKITHMKYRGDGWPGYFKVNDLDKEFRMKYDEAWGENLGRSVPLTCKICIDSVGDCADVVFGDAWESDDNGYPVFTENAGNNLIIARNNKADNLLSLSEESGYMVLNKTDVKQFRKIQPSQTIRRSTANIRVNAIRITKLSNIKFNKEHLKNISINNFSFPKKVRFYFGTLRRIAKVVSK